MSKKTETVKLIVTSIINVFTGLLLANEGETVSKKKLKKTFSAEATIKMLEKEVRSHLKKEKLVDPDAPKRGLNSYLLFCQAKRQKIKTKMEAEAQERGEELNGKDVTAALALAWKGLSDSKKAKYKAKAQEEKERAIAAKKEYIPKSEEELRLLPENQKKSRKKKKYKDIKNPRNSFTFYSLEQREAVKNETGLKGPELTKMLGKIWKELPAESKKHYEKMAKKDVKRYEKEVAQYEATLGSVEDEEVHSNAEDSVVEDSKAEDSKAEEEPQKIEKTKKKDKKNKKNKKTKQTSEEDEDLYTSDVDKTEEEVVAKSSKKKTKIVNVTFE